MAFIASQRPILPALKDCIKGDIEESVNIQTLQNSKMESLLPDEGDEDLVAMKQDKNCLQLDLMIDRFKRDGKTQFKTILSPST